ncbi:MAG: hypothetical protein LC118_07850 [Dehalococcoidia bacterium]|nr:hypothetical protein [Dehalococcoidia bacterium]
MSAIIAGVWLAGTRDSDATPERQVSAFQQGLVKDGTITPEEYRKAANAMATCLRSAGIDVAEPRLGATGRYEFDYLSGHATVEETRALGNAYEDCYWTYLSESDRATQLSPAFQQDAIGRGNAIQRCVEARKPGFQFSSDQTELIRQVADLDRSADATFTACYREVVTALFANTGQTGGSVDIGYQPLQR